MKPQISFKHIRTTICLTLIIAFVGSSLYIPQAQAGEMVLPRMPEPGVMVQLSSEFTPAHLQGLTIHPDNALQFDFLIHKGDGQLDNEQKKEEYTKLVKYFLASLTIPDEDQWVNLSPYEHNRIIKDDFGKTEMGRDLLSQDYLLKQITSSLMYPESGLGKEFWDKIYERAYKEFGTTDVPVNTFNKVWIIPDEAAVYESGNTVYILRDHLKVMLEEDYLSLEKHSETKQSNAHSMSSQIIKQILLPELQKEVNEGKNFAMLRQIYSGMILATWYKHALKESLLGKVYANKAKVSGVDQKDPQANEAIYQRYLRAFKKGVFNYIKEDADKYSQQLIPRKYFAGGLRGFSGVRLGNAAMTTYPINGEIIDFKTLNVSSAMLATFGATALAEDVDMAEFDLKTPLEIVRRSVNHNAVEDLRNHAPVLIQDLEEMIAKVSQEVNQGKAYRRQEDKEARIDDDKFKVLFLNGLTDLFSKEYRINIKFDQSFPVFALNGKEVIARFTDGHYRFVENVGEEGMPNFGLVGAFLEKLAAHIENPGEDAAMIHDVQESQGLASLQEVGEKQAVEDLRGHNIVLRKALEEIVVEASKEIVPDPYHFRVQGRDLKADDEDFKIIFSTKLNHLFNVKYGIDLEFGELTSIGPGVLAWNGIEVVKRSTNGQYGLVEVVGGIVGKEDFASVHGNKDDLMNILTNKDYIDEYGVINGEVVRNLKSAGIDLSDEFNDQKGSILDILQDSLREMSMPNFGLVGGFLKNLADLIEKPETDEAMKVPDEARNMIREKLASLDLSFNLDKKLLNQARSEQDFIRIINQLMEQLRGNPYYQQQLFELQFDLSVVFSREEITQPSRFRVLAGKIRRKLNWNSGRDTAMIMGQKKVLTYGQSSGAINYLDGKSIDLYLPINRKDGRVLKIARLYDMKKDDPGRRVINLGLGNEYIISDGMGGVKVLRDGETVKLGKGYEVADRFAIFNINDPSSGINKGYITMTRKGDRIEVIDYFRGGARTLGGTVLRYPVRIRLYDLLRRAVSLNRNNKLILTSASKSIPRKSGSVNQDALLVDPERGLSILADGMGGYSHGEIASQTAVNAADHLLSKTEIDSFTSLGEIRTYLAKVVYQANQAVIREANRRGVDFMGTTFVLNLVWKDPYSGKIYTITVHKGDSRGYILKAKGELEQITKDDNKVQRMLREGILTPEQARNHPERNLVTDCLGIVEEYTSDGVLTKDQFKAQEIKNGDIVILATDGVFGNLEDREIAGINTHNLNAFAEDLVLGARRKGKVTDDTTAGVMRVNVNAAMAAVFTNVDGNTIDIDGESFDLLEKVFREIRKDNIKDVHGHPIQPDFIKPMLDDLVLEAAERNKRVASINMLIAMSRVFNVIGSDPNTTMKIGKPIYSKYRTSIQAIVNAQDLSEVEDILRKTSLPEKAESKFITPEFREFIKNNFSEMPQMSVQEGGEDIQVVDLGSPIVQDSIKAQHIPIVVPDQDPDHDYDHKVVTLITDDQLLARAKESTDYDQWGRRIVVSQDGIIYFIKRPKEEGGEFRILYPFQLDYEDSGLALGPEVLSRIPLDFRQKLIAAVERGFQSNIIIPGHPDPKRANLLVRIVRNFNSREGYDLEFKPIDWNRAMITPTRGGIDFNSANMNLQIKRDGNGVPLPLLQQDWAQLSQIQGFIPTIVEIRPVASLPILSELQQKLRQTSTSQI